MGSTQSQANYPATEEDLTAALNSALAAGDLEGIMGALGRMARAHRMRRVARETGLGEKSLYKSMRAGASPEFNTVLRVTRALGFRLQVVPVAECERQKNMPPPVVDNRRRHSLGTSYSNEEEPI